MSDRSDHKRLSNEHSRGAEGAVSFDEFFELGEQEEVSPFISKQSIRWGVNLYLKVSIFSAFLLVGAYALTFFSGMMPIAHLMLLFVFFFVGIPSLIESIEDLFQGSINIDILMTLAAFSSLLIGTGFEGGLLLVLFAISGAMEHTVTDKAKSAISRLKEIAPSTALVKSDEGEWIEIALADVAVGDQILVKAGEVVPLDGDVEEGNSSVNLSHLTGENVPVIVSSGSRVPGGARNIEGALRIRVTHTSADSTLARIIKLVTKAQEAKPTLQRWFDRLSDRYATAIIILAFTFATSFPFLFGIPFFGEEGALYRSLAFLIAASPCALIIAIPIAYLSAVGACARKGILLKGGTTLDALAGCKIFAFDKTGTLTLGRLECLSLTRVTSSSYTDEEALQAALTLEQNAVHPVATALVDYAKAKGLKELPLKSFVSVPGMGLEGSILVRGQEVSVKIGRIAFVCKEDSQEKKSLLDQMQAELSKEGAMGAAMQLGEALYFFKLRDTLRPNIAESVDSLKQKSKIRLVMLTGDHEASARFVADALGIDEYYADLSPEDKLDHVSRLAESEHLAMIGDGVNDAPALARASVGISMGQVGSATAMEASDIVLLHDDLKLLDWLVSRSQKTQHIVKQNLLIATVAMIGASIPAILGMVPLWLAVIAHEGGTVIVGLNALRLLKR
ncbi:MAG: cation-translocating P-type ATPase [Chlamydiia bacterium]|nr:cation-translocating P-type ATPase [Chlamydiia bacterium]